MNYTKGKWEIRKLPITGGLAIYAGNDLIAAGVEEANAQLIASAPDLYEACREIAKSPQPSSRAKAMVKQALSKVEGK